MGSHEPDKKQQNVSRPIGLKQLAAHLGLDPATISVVLNDVPGRSIPQTTRDRIKAAAKEMNYQPSLLARSLRDRRTLSIGILVPNLGDGYHTQILSGIGEQLVQAGYFYFTAHHRHQQKLVEDYTRMLIGRGAQGIIAVDTLIEHAVPVPAVAVAGHRIVKGITNVCLNHLRAAELALLHLHSLGHRRIAFMHGQTFSSDSDARWQSLVAVTEKLGLAIDPDLVVTLDRDLSSPELGYPVVQRLIESKKPFTAIVAFNDISAMGCIRALQDHRLRVPEDVSVLGFDNIQAAAYTLPRLTTISQSITEMGRIAAQSLLNRLHNTELPRSEIVVEPELVFRESTGPVKSMP